MTGAVTDTKTLAEASDARAIQGHYGAEFISARGRAHKVGDRVRVSGCAGTIIRKHPDSGLPEIEWDKVANRESKGGQMSAVDYKASLERLVNVMRGQAGYTVEDIVKIILIEEAKLAAPKVPKEETVRMISVELANGATKLYPDTPEFREQLAKETEETKAKAANTAEPQSDDDIDSLINQAEKDLAMLRGLKA